MSRRQEQPVCLGLIAQIHVDPTTEEQSEGEITTKVRQDGVNTCKPSMSHLGLTMHSGKCPVNTPGAQTDGEQSLHQASAAMFPGNHPLPFILLPF